MMNIEEMIGKPYKSKDKNIRPCWAFCREVVESMGGVLGETPDGMEQLLQAELWSIVLFNFKYDWHAGIIWPDGLHFVHYDEERKQVCKDRLTIFPWKLCIEGYYIC